MPDAKSKIAIIYCRVSSLKQATKGDGLTSQETRCREYAKYKGYRVVEVFRDDLSGGIAARPGMMAALIFLRKHRADACVMIIDDISRLARGLEAHIQLRTAISGAGGRLESPSIEFGEDSDSILVENLLASVSQHQRQKNGEQTMNRMRARASNGYWVFKAPVGYRYERVSGQGKMLVRNEPHASVVQEALQSYASGRFQTQSEVKRFLEQFSLFPRTARGEVLSHYVTEILTRVLYAGYVEVPEWGIGRTQGKHEALISFETYQAIQERLLGNARVPTRADLSQDFPLRGFVTCACCERPMTACWSRGRNQSYPYYFCITRDCASRRKSIRCEKIESEFESLLKTFTPTEDLFMLAFDMFRDQWEARAASFKEHGVSLELERAEIDRKVGQLLDRIVDTDSETVVSAYEKRVKELEDRKIVLSEKIKSCGRPLRTFDESFRTAFDFLANPHKLWASDRIEDRRAVLKLVFADRLAYHHEEGFRTAETTLPFKALEGLSLGKFEMARPTGIEPVFSP
jgi:site-specific DNA recombinase